MLSLLCTVRCMVLCLRVCACSWRGVLAPRSHTANTEVMETMWNNFNEIAEGFGLNVNEFVKICDIEGLRATAQDARAVFQAFDTDQVRFAVVPHASLRCGGQSHPTPPIQCVTRTASLMRWSS